MREPKQTRATTSGRILSARSLEANAFATRHAASGSGLFESFKATKVPFSTPCLVVSTCVNDVGFSSAVLYMYMGNGKSVVFCNDSSVKVVLCVPLMDSATWIRIPLRRKERDVA